MPRLSLIANNRLGDEQCIRATLSSMFRSQLLLLTFGLLMASGLVCDLHARSSTQNSSQLDQQVPVIDGGAGPCSLLLTVTADSGPVYAAVIKVHIEYGFGGFRRLDLQASTNVNGKAKFTGLPSRVKRPPLEFQASSSDLAGTATFNPSDRCQATRDIALQKPKP